MAWPWPAPTRSAPWWQGPDEKRCWSPGYQEAEEGPAFTVQQVNGIGVGLLNCYEAEFAELTRSLALLGAQVVLIPTAADAWAQLSDGRRTDRPYPDISRTLLPAHAFESRCFVAYVNRCGEETVNGRPWPATWATASCGDPTEISLWPQEPNPPCFWPIASPASMVKHTPPAPATWRMSGPISSAGADLG